MFKKLFIASAILVTTSTVAFANGAPYVGLATGVVVNTADLTNFRGFPGIVFAGYGANLGQGFYLGGEVLATFGSVTIINNGLKSTYNYGISILPGIMISDHTMGYARFGIVSSRFTPTGTGTSNGTVTGGQFGLGLQTSLTQNWDLRGEYTFTASRAVSGVSGNPRTDEATVGLVYKFD